MSCGLVVKGLSRNFRLLSLLGIFPDPRLLQVLIMRLVCACQTAAMRPGKPVRLGSVALAKVAFKNEELAKIALGAFNPLRPEPFSCDHAFLRKSMSIYAYGMSVIEVRLSVAASFACCHACFLAMGGHGGF